MLQVTYRKSGVLLSHIWFASEEQIRCREFEKEKASLYYLHGVPCDISLLEKSGGVQLSIIKTLENTEDELFLSLGKHLRQYIKRSKKEDIVTVRIFDSNYLAGHSLILSSCKMLYEKMFRDKDMNIRFNERLANAYIKKGSLVIGMAFIGDMPVGFSAVVYHQENARLWVAAFDFRNDSFDSQVLSRGHQRLDWELLLWCKKQGVHYFDFGGINSFENPDGISKFKMSFEKDNKVEYNNIIIAGNALGKLALKCIIRR